MSAHLAVGPGTPALTNEQCSPYTVHYAYDTAALARVTGPAVVKAGGKTWYFLTADYAFGTAMQNDLTKVINDAGGSVVGSVRVPLSASDFSSFMLRTSEQGANHRPCQAFVAVDKVDLRITHWGSSSATCAAAPPSSSTTHVDERSNFPSHRPAQSLPLTT